MRYKGHEIFHCWCGYPEKRWMVYKGGRWVRTCKTLKEAKQSIV